MTDSHAPFPSFPSLNFRLETGLVGTFDTILYATNEDSLHLLLSPKYIPRDTRVRRRRTSYLLIMYAFIHTVISLGHVDTSVLHPLLPNLTQPSSPPSYPPNTSTNPNSTSPVETTIYPHPTSSRTWSEQLPLPERIPCRRRW